MTIESPIIRVARSRDIPFLATLNAEVQELHFANRPDQFKPPNATDLEEWFEELLQNAGATVWVAESDGTPVGYVAVLVRERQEGPFCPARVWWDLDSIGVAATHRRSGICRALLEKVVSEANNQKVQEVELSSWAFNEVARRAFENLGFVPKLVRYEFSDPEGDERFSP